MKTCESCGRIMLRDDDFGGNKKENAYCSNCTDEYGHLLNQKKVVQSMKNLLIKQMSLSDDVAEKMAKENLQNSTIWNNKKSIALNAGNIVITDIGSTTTKAILIRKNKKSGETELFGPELSTTTVEIPDENVMKGVYHSIKKLEESSRIPLLSNTSSDVDFTFLPGTVYLTTSSAGGGLQILVVGLTTFDSASSAQRAAYGAGGVLLDVVAIDDKRSNLEKISAIQAKNPDIILFCGGFDNGAIQTLTRLAEMLTLAEPLPKFGSHRRIPLIFAGNSDAIPFIENTLSDVYELFILPNLRPSAQIENLLPVRHIINQIFMEKVMEYAPGYADLKPLVSDSIIPTPNGVMNTLDIISSKYNQNIMCVDIGGATTDIFSNILGNFYRTVSANIGMSYSISNVLKETGISEIMKWLPENFDENYVRNYISNKTLFTSIIPSDDTDMAIEHAVAREALKIAKLQHMQMHFNTEKIGFLDKMKRMDLDRYIETFYAEKMESKRYFHNKDISVLIGAGSVISKAKTIEQAAIMLIDGLQPEGITDIIRDHDFIMPHLGILSGIDPATAEKLIFENCLEKLVTHIRPLSEKWKQGKTVLKMSVKSEYFSKEVIVQSGDFIYLKNPENIKFELRISLEKGYYLQNEERELLIETQLPVIVDCRIPGIGSAEAVNSELSLYNFPKVFSPVLNKKANSINRKDSAVVNLTLPFTGELYVKEGENITPGQIVAENKYDPPKMFILSLYSVNGIKADTEDLKKYLLVKEGDIVENDQLVLDMRKPEQHLNNLVDDLIGVVKTYHSNVRGIIEKINYATGVIVMREIQDYPDKPVKFNISAKICVNPDKVKTYLKKQLGDFVYKGEVIASRFDSNGYYFAYSPATGNIIDFDYKNGTAVIKYERKGFKIISHFSGKVIHTEKNKIINCEVKGQCIPALIGFGGENGGNLLYQKSPDFSKELGRKIIVTSYADLDALRNYKKAGIAGLVVASLDEKTLSQFTETELNIAFSGNESIPFPILITNSFGKADFPADLTDLFEQSKGKWAYLHALTQIRAGVIRPFLIIQ